MYLLTAVIGLLALYLVATLSALARNVRAARASGLPYLVSLGNPNNVLWMMLSIPARPLLQRLLPGWAWRRTQPLIYGWEFHSPRGARNPVLDDLGPVFVIAAPGGNKLWIAEPALALDVLARKKDFVRLPMTKTLMGRFGPNVLTHDGDDWQRMRRIVAPLLNERISALVWTESLAQARQMFAHFSAQAHGETDRIVGGCRTVAMNVLGAAGYGTPAPWRPNGEAGVKPPPGRRLTFLDAIGTVSEHMAPALLLPPWLCQLPVFPWGVRKIGVAAGELEDHADDLVRRARNEAGGAEATTVDGGNSLTATMVRISDAEKKTGGKTALHLSEAEMRGSIFQFTLAGYDTTANTLSYAFVLLALYPQWQDWLREEVDAALPDPATTPAYDDVYPKLNRCLAVMHETLRLYTPVAHVSRLTAGPTTLTSSRGTHAIAAATEVYVTGASLHVLPSHWGADPLTFRPARFLDAQETLWEPPKGTFLPWSAGPRYCPGLKMSQVEFVAVLAAAVRGWRVALAPRAGESEAACTERYEGLLRDSQPVVTLQMNRPREARLRWTRRA